MISLKFAIALLCLSVIASNASAQASASSGGANKCPADIVSADTRQNSAGGTEYAFQFRFDDGQLIEINYARNPIETLEWSKNRVLLPCPPSPQARRPSAEIDVPTLGSNSSDNADSTISQVIAQGIAQIGNAYANRKIQQAAATRSSNGSYNQPAYSPPIGTSTSSGSHRAPLAPASCATYRVTRYEPLWDSAAIEWRNTCNFPIEVNWCWVKPGQTRCKTDNAGSMLSPGETDIAVGPTGVANPVASYYVCNMSDSSKLCAGWD